MYQNDPAEVSGRAAGRIYHHIVIPNNKHALFCNLRLHLSSKFASLFGQDPHAGTLRLTKPHTFLCDTSGLVQWKHADGGVLADPGLNHQTDLSPSSQNRSDATGPTQRHWGSRTTEDKSRTYGSDSMSAQDSLIRPDPLSPHALLERSVTLHCDMKHPNPK